MHVHSVSFATSCEASGHATDSARNAQILNLILNLASDGDLAEIVGTLQRSQRMAVEHPDFADLLIGDMPTATDMLYDHSRRVGFLMQIDVLTAS